ncbi:MAG: hypothetical protein ACI8Y4_004612 [Candidatus Poriferisodalaceae bacterium]|jgi:hypothetical protein
MEKMRVELSPMTPQRREPSQPNGRPNMPTTSVNGHRSLIELMTPAATDDPSVFTGLANPHGALGVYGGHFVGQALAAGLATVDEPKFAH